MFDRTDDTIVAISSPPGISLRGIVRLSGPDALKWGQQLFEAHEGPPLTQSPGHRRYFGRVRLEGSATVPAEAWIFRAPASYTRQDMLELHLPGSPPVLTIIHDALTARGARPAEPGEFTARAYFSGALDLTRVEGVAALIHARNDSQLRASHALLTGTLSRRSIELRDRLADLLSVLEAQIDFVEESIEFVTTGQAGSVVGEVAAELDELLGAADSVERLEALPVVMLVGRPNAGKSTLFNRLTGVDRAIQSATAGTTRDVLSMPLMLPGGEVTLQDSAGIAGGLPSAGASSCFDPGRLAEAATRRGLDTADLLLAVVDATDAPLETLALLRPLLAGRSSIVVLNKIDAAPADEVHALSCEFLREETFLRVSARTGRGLETLRKRIAQALFAGVESHGSELLALSSRQLAGLRDARAALARSADLLEKSTILSSSIELLALEIREAMNALSLLVGEVATEELLGRIFSRFCIGK